MNRVKVAVMTLFLLTVVFSCQKKSKEPTIRRSFSLNMEAISTKLMERSHLQPGERVLLMGKPGEFDSLIVLLSQKIKKAGAVYFGTISVDSTSWPEGWKTDFTRSTEGKTKEELGKLFHGVDLGIMLPGATPADVPYKALQDVLNLGKVRTIHFHWSGAYDFSTNPVPIDTNVSKVYEKALLETDYQKLSKILDEFERALRKDGAKITTSKGTNLTFKIGDRPVTKQDGDASLARTQKARNLIDREIELPAGAIRVAPLEETVEGTIAFPDALWNDQKVEGLVLTFKKGKVTDINALIGAAAVKAELDRGGEAGHSFRELAVGFNPLLAIPEDKHWIPYYGYGAGVVRLSLGDNSELGGKVTGGYVRWNLFTDATVIVGNEVWVKNGKLLRLD